MAIGSNVTIEIETGALPIIPGVLEMAAANRSGGMATNRDHFVSQIEFRTAVSEDLRDLVFDPQTSGGLLISVGSEDADRLAEKLSKAGIQANFVGFVGERARKPVVFG